MDDAMRRSCDQLIKNLMKRSQGVHFSKPVEWKKMGLLDYPKLIKEPMDLSTVADQLTNSHYVRLEGFVNDVRLVWVRLPSPCAPSAAALPTSIRFTRALAQSLYSPRASRVLHATAAAASGVWLAHC